LDKLIKLAELFNITVDELVKDEKEIIQPNNIDRLIENETKEKISNKEIEKDDENNWENAESEKRIFEINKIKIKNLIVIIIIFLIIVVAYKFVSEKLTLLKREKDIKEIAEVYNEQFRSIGETESAFIVEKVSKKENNNIINTYTHYYIYAENGKKLMRASVYDDENTRKLLKEIYIDLSKKTYTDLNTNMRKYDDVTEVYVEDWSYKNFDDYEFISPIDRISDALENRYFDIEHNAENIALDENNFIHAVKMPRHNLKNYGWSYGTKDNSEREDYLSFYMTLPNYFLSLYFDDYKNDIADSREIVSIQVSRQNGNIDDVTVPEL
ncbi:MAG: hypothetical protein IKJ72_02530, partial [Mycoplasmataceae bacterium]|nr:hypothetical protein [Mycoplasmataceae bacterium]